MIMNHPNAHPYQLKIMPPARQYDHFGSGAFSAPRGDHKHNGIDLECPPDSIICALHAGVVTKLGYPYNPTDPHKGHLRYVQITDTEGNDHRIFYIAPFVDIDQIIEVGQAVGISQSLQDIYPGITDHIHYEVKQDGVIIDPTPFLTK